MSTIVGAVYSCCPLNAMASKADRIVGTILGAALGDAVGLCTEFLGFQDSLAKITLVDV